MQTTAYEGSDQKVVLETREPLSSDLAMRKSVLAFIRFFKNLGITL